MGINVIRWKLNELMARKRIRNKDLAEALGITENSVYRLRRIDEMPRLAPERLNGICAVLKCQPGELLEWIPDSDGDQEVVTAQEKLAQGGESIDAPSSKRQGFRFLLGVIRVNVIPEVEQPATGVQPRDFGVYITDDEEVA